MNGKPIILLASLCLVLAACLPQPLAVAVVNDCVAEQSLPRQVERADRITLGRFTELAGQVRTEEIIDASQQPDPRALVGDPVYQFEVERYLKGEGEPTLSVVVGGPEAGATPQATQLNFPHLEIPLQTQVLAFLRAAPGFPEGKYFVALLDPWLFIITDQNQAVPQYACSYYLGAPQISTWDLEALIGQIQHPQIAITPSASPTPLSTSQTLRLINQSSYDLQNLEVIFPDERVAFGDVPAGSTSAYHEFPHGVYRYAAYGVEIDGKRYEQPVIDWVGESPMDGQSFTYVLDVDPSRWKTQGWVIHLVRAEKD